MLGLECCSLTKALQNFAASLSRELFDYSFRFKVSEGLVAHEFVLNLPGTHVYLKTERSGEYAFRAYLDKTRDVAHG